MPPPDIETLARAIANLFILGIAGIGCCMSVFFVFTVLVVMKDVIWAIRKWQTTGAIIGMHKEMKRGSPDRTLHRANRGENEIEHKTTDDAQSTSRSQSSKKEKLLVIILILLIGFVLTLTCVVVMGYYSSLQTL